MPGRSRKMRGSFGGRVPQTEERNAMPRRSRKMRGSFGGRVPQTEERNAMPRRRPLADEILFGKLLQGSGQVRVDVKGDETVLEVAEGNNEKDAPV